MDREGGAGGSLGCMLSGAHAIVKAKVRKNPLGAGTPGCTRQGSHGILPTTLSVSPSLSSRGTREGRAAENVQGHTAGQLQGVQEKWARDPLLQPLNLRVRKLAARLAPLLHRSIFYLRLSDPEYLREFQPTIQPGFWKLPQAWTHTNASMVYPTFQPEDSFSEEHSDLCLVQLLGTGADDRQPCRLSDFCRTLMTRPGCSGYCLSHQLLFFLLARMKGCMEGLFCQTQLYMNLFCANMMDLNQRAEAIGYAYSTQDIFMENIMLCGIAGFSDFYKLRWLEVILAWQKPREGCFGTPDAEDEELLRAVEHQQHFLTRVKRREKQFTGH
ncbi:UPF0764 protein C16orf89 homolog isoform X3 [Equus quagga]|uniref:UPF0764 protein C16orf89 homolog isoform X3 n=1 Tax=Equus quagga TaxID=89248 RepID=UPI001EE386D7|nr:UPF0764 protein C16orf89 homolog isoform X3 [Equus quagga]